ncbi:MAG: carboxypeptidase regulatory-like domain-containing protein [Sandaracinaceae bacterium]
MRNTISMAAVLGTRKRMAWPSGPGLCLVVRCSLGLAWALAAPSVGWAQPVVSVRAETRIELRVAAEPGGVRVEGALRDDRGDALGARRVQLTLSTVDGAPSREEVTTGEDGGFSFRFDVRATSYRISARFEGEPGYLGETVAQDLDLARAHVRLGLARADGEALDRIDLDRPDHPVRVTARSEAGSADLQVELTNEVSEVLAAGRTDAEGYVTLTMRAAQLGPPAAGRLVVRTPGDARRAAAQVEMPVVRFRQPSLELRASPTQVRAGEAVTVEGQLSDSTGPLARRAVGLFDGAEHLTTVLTDDRGEFARSLDAGDAPLSLTARFVSDAPWRPSAHSALVVVEVNSSGGPGGWWLLIPMLLSGAILLLLRARRAAPPSDSVAVVRPTAGVEAGTVVSRTADRLEVAGVVYDADEDRPLLDAIIVLRGAAEDLRTHADEGGAFRFDSVSPGAWTLIVEAAGYEPRESRVEVPHRGGWSSITVRLLSLRQAVIRRYQGLAQILAPEPKWWAFWTPRELVKRAPRAVRSDVADLTERVENAAYGAVPPAPEEVAEISRRVDELARRAPSEDDQVSGQR